MKDYLDSIFAAVTIEGVCTALQDSLDEMKKIGDLVKLPVYYETISARTPLEIQQWHDDMQDDEQAEVEGMLREVLSLFVGTLSQLRKLGFRRSSS